ncbi:sulfur carrier protein ThiS [Bermanella marisrubri]|uniref:Thiamine biosynthesis protein ThiS n=1 Tax=Bermanella marisrubri TaxID=207949 RepID=Q1MYG2_9GAMM|nr:sulfur carrier protein ThiS [Bermanella marisrubri]EAT10983.1 hypothetical protein RED65_02138 [Oceanobacter sp. RED65] [Bermanella marisrubri]QIZ83771.1 sulfur carrier protein ThiS [Bermanella marisrubri]
MTASSDQKIKIKIRVNGEEFATEQPALLIGILQEHVQKLDIDLEHCVIAVNQCLVHRHQYDEFELKDNDEVDILTAVVGG